MKKVFALFIFLPVCGMGQNMVFNPGFDMVPWDTGWTIVVDTASGYDAVAIAEAKPDTGKSPPNCCYLKTYVYTEFGGGFAHSKAIVSQIFNPIAACKFKAQIKYWWYNLRPTGSWEARATIEACIDEQWQVIWDTVPSSNSGGDTVWSEISIDINGQIKGIKFITISRLNVSSGPDAVMNFHIWLDDICIEEMGVEESKELKVKSGELKVSRNPFIKYTTIELPYPQAKVKVYDVMGKLIEETDKEIIGEGLQTGIYFVRVKGYKPLKIIKVGRVK